MPQVPDGTPVPSAYYRISNAGTFAVKNVPGALYSLNINSGTGASTITLFDQVGTATGTVDIAVINVGTADVLPLNVPFGATHGGLRFNNGLAVLTTGTIDLTVGFK